MYVSTNTSLKPEGEIGEEPFSRGDIYRVTVVKVSFTEKDGQSYEVTGKDDEGKNIYGHKPARVIDSTEETIYVTEQPERPKFTIA